LPFLPVDIIIIQNFAKLFKSKFFLLTQQSFSTYNLAQALPLAHKAQSFPLDKDHHWRSKAA
jgi:hypothetical protein